MKIFTDSINYRKFLSILNESSCTMDLNIQNYEINTMKYIIQITKSRLDFKSRQPKLLVSDPSVCFKVNRSLPFIPFSPRGNQDPLPPPLALGLKLLHNCIMK